MFENTLEQWALDQWKKGIADTLNKQMILKFGEVPAWAKQRLANADKAELSAWVENILTADSLEVVFAD